MFEVLTRMFTKPEAVMVDHDPKLAVAALLVHLAAVDGEATPQERIAVKGVLQDQYGLDEASVDTLIRQAMARDAEAVDLYNFTSALSRLDSSERIEIIRMMWLVVFADKKNHEP
ncbi:TerB family tellurite resistance protein [Devosia algicola]|uniref:TerB family tellurite resistance protein n=1 Tax=Devosia algicola TaxID=3026418 RepID=A0ABY7YL65_9HYPH|nr:TerB family tellurite resistance protein [Devosia algicola]WDR01710.1 TerB family tellurite resistance protein [Devosia algicola]